jgi:uncharacterized membrane protein YgaE (UPF0421/DUF939 family)
MTATGGPNSVRARIDLALRAALASVVGVAVAQLLRLPYPLYALLAAVLVSDTSGAITWHRGAHYLLGTTLGAIAGAVLGFCLGAGLWVIGVAVFAAILSCLLLGLTEASKVAGYVAGIVVLEESDHRWGYAFERFCETAIGVGSALLVAWGFRPPTPANPAPVTTGNSDTPSYPKETPGRAP